jgi:hypothetical protein
MAFICSKHTKFAYLHTAAAAGEQSQSLVVAADATQSHNVTTTPSQVYPESPSQGNFDCDSAPETAVTVAETFLPEHPVTPILEPQDGGYESRPETTAFNTVMIHGMTVVVPHEPEAAENILKLITSIMEDSDRDEWCDVSHAEVTAATQASSAVDSDLESSKFDLDMSDYFDWPDDSGEESGS